MTQHTSLACSLFLILCLSCLFLLASSSSSYDDASSSAHASLRSLLSPHSSRTRSALSSSPSSPSPSPDAEASLSHRDGPLDDLWSDLFDDDDDDGDDDEDEQQAAFYLAHVQCRRCLRDNSLFKAPCPSSTSQSSSSSPSSSSRADDDDDDDDRACCGAQCSLPEFQPMLAMQWCPRAAGSDWEGGCVEALASCPAPVPVNASVPAPIVAYEGCPGDAAPSKLTCVLCVLDAYAWVTRQGAVAAGDNYAGHCVASAAPAQLSGDTVVVREMDGCPSFVRESNGRGRYHLMSFLLLFFLTTTALCLCCGMRWACVAWQARKVVLGEEEQLVREGGMGGVPVLVLPGAPLLGVEVGESEAFSMGAEPLLQPSTLGQQQVHVQGMGWDGYAR